MRMTKVLQEQTNLYNKNLYAYCDNNPIIKKDATGGLGFLDGVSSAINLSNAANLTIKPNKLPEDLAINMTNEIFGFGTGLVVGM